MSLIQVIPLGGANEIGKSCTVVSEGNDMIIIDVGLSFPNEDILGIDIVIPDFTYIIENKQKLKGIFLTHAHEDHIGSLPFLLSQINCPIYGSEITIAMVRAKLEEKIPNKKLDLRIIKSGEKISAGKLIVEPIRLTHSIPQNHGMAVHTSKGIIFFTSDFKFDFSPVDCKPSDIHNLTSLAKEGVLLLLSDTTNVDREGWSPSELSVQAGLEKAFSEAKGRTFLTTFASNIHRIQQVLTVAEKLGKKVTVAGRRMEQTIELCYHMGYIKAPKGVFIGLEQINEYPPDQLIILTTGSQGEPLAALTQMSKETYNRLRIVKGDTIIYSARPIPGNEGAIWRTINRLFDMGAHVIYDSVLPIHASGHAYKEELKMMIHLTQPYYLAPIHGEARHQYIYNEMALNMGYPEHRMFKMQSGIPLCIDDTSAWLGDPVPSGELFIDKSGNAGVNLNILKERTHMAHDGVITVNVLVDKKARKIIRSPELQSKGFSGNPRALEFISEFILDEFSGKAISQYRDSNQLEYALLETSKKMIYKKTQLKPMVLVHLTEV